MKSFLILGFAASKKKNKQKINWIRLAEHGRISTKNVKYRNPRIKYDGLHWYITAGIEYESSDSLPSNEGIGVDLGVKDLVICSDGQEFVSSIWIYSVQKHTRRSRSET